MSQGDETSKCPDCHGEGEVYGGDWQTGCGPEPCLKCDSTGLVPWVMPTPEQVIAKIAEVAHAIGWQAGVGGMETAGSLVSVLAAHPEKIAGFMSGELDIISDDALLRPDQGCLTWRAQNGGIFSPAQARAAKHQHDH